MITATLLAYVFHVVWPYHYPDTTVELVIEATTAESVGEELSVDGTEKGHVLSPPRQSLRRGKMLSTSNAACDRRLCGP